MIYFWLVDNTEIYYITSQFKAKFVYEVNSLEPLNYVKLAKDFCFKLFSANITKIANCYGY